MRVHTWRVIAVSTGLLAGASVSSAAEPNLFLELTNAFERAAEGTNRVPPPPLPSSVPSTRAPQDFTLLGVVKADEKQFALIGRATGTELIPVGASLAGYRLIEVGESQATFEGERGERMVLQLQNGEPGAAAGPARPAATPNH